MANKNKIISQAQKYITKGQWDKAVKELQKLVAEDPSDVRSLLKLGDVYSKKGDRENATKVYKQVAESYSDQGFFLKAVAVYKQILKHDPTHLQVTLKLAELYEHLGLTSEAMAQYHRASQLQEEQGKQKETLDVLKRMVDLDADNVASRIKLAESFSRENMLPEAISEFERAADILRKQNRVDDYIKVAERLVYHDQTRLDVIKELARLYLDRGDAKRGLAKLQICFKAQPRDIEVLKMLSQAFGTLGQHQKTIFVFKELARVYQDEGRVGDASEVLQQILQLDPNDADARQMLSGPNPDRVAPPLRMPPPPVEEVRLPKPTPPPPFMAPTLSVTSPPPPPAATPVPMLGPSLSPRPGSIAPLPMGGGEWSVPSQPGYPFGTSPTPSVESRPAPRPPSLVPRPPPPVEDEARPPKMSRPGMGASRDNAQIAKVLTETDVYIKYGLREKALSHLRRVFEIDPDNVDAYMKMRDIYRSMGDNARAAEAVANVMHVHNKRGELGLLEAARADLAKLVPGHPLVSSGIPGSLPGPLSAAEISDEISVDIDDDGEPDVLELVEEVQSEPALTVPPFISFEDEPLDVDHGSGAHSSGIQVKSDDLISSRRDDIVFEAATDRGGRPLISDLATPLIHDEDLPEASSGLIMLSEVETGAELDDSRPSFAEEVDEEEEGEALITIPPQPRHEVDPFAGNERSEVTARSMLDDARREVTDRSSVDTLFAHKPTVMSRDVTHRVSPDDPAFTLDDPAFAVDESTDRDEGPSIDLIADIALAAGALIPEEGNATDELDEAEFLIEAELVEEARDLVGSILERFPMNERAAEMMMRVEALERRASAATEDDDEAENTSPLGEPALPLDGQALPPDDGTGPEDRYDQGMLFKEIGRIDDAIREFRGAARHQSRYLQSLEMIGHCLIEKGSPTDAIAYFSRALDRGADGISATNLKYEIGNAHEAAGDRESAYEWFSACSADDPDHRDVQERVAQLGPRPNGAKKGNGIASDAPRASSAKKSKITYL